MWSSNPRLKAKVLPRHHYDSPRHYGVLALLTSLLLVGCGHESEKHPPLQTVDIDKIERVAFDFHFRFFDEHLTPIELNDKEVAYFHGLVAWLIFETSDLSSRKSRRCNDRQAFRAWSSCSKLNRRSPPR